MDTVNSDQNLIKANSPKKRELLIIRLLVAFGVISLIIFVHWFLKEHRMGHPLLYWLLNFALLFKLMRMLHEWYHYLDISVPAKPVRTKEYSVDVLTTACPGEPKEMIINTLKAMTKITYPHTNYLCDEGNDPELKKVCEELGVIHVTRTEKIDAKAGNINNALKNATGELCVILDPDHVPIPEFLDRVLPYFEDPDVGYVQCVQAYGNRRESFVALGAAEQTYHFYGPMNMCMNSYGTTQAIGANCTFRRSALDSIGGHAAGLAEDMHTSMLLHAKGWKSVYIPELLTRGLVPSSLSAYYKQQLKWSRGTFDIFFTTFLKNFRKFTWRQRVHYMTVPLYFFYGVIDFINILIPILSLFLAEYPWIIDFKDFIRMILPLIIITLLIRQYSQRWLMETHERGLHIVGGLLRIGTWWIFSLGFIYTLLKIKVPYIPTPKDDKPQNEWKLCIPNIIAFFLSIGAAVYGLNKDWNPYSFFMAGFAIVNSIILGISILISQQKLIVSSYKGLSDKIRLDVVWPVRTIFWKVRHAFYNLVRNESLTISLFTIFILLSFTVHSPKINLPNKVHVKDVGGFYAGIHLTSFNIGNDIIPGRNQEDSLSYKVFSVKQNWGESIDRLSFDFFDKVASKGGITMIAWEPYGINAHSDSVRSIFHAIHAGEMDDYINDYARYIKAIRLPVFIRFASHPDNKLNINTTNKNYDKDYCKAWRHIVRLFKAKGVSNAIWVFNPKYSTGFNNFYPGNEYVDWVGVTCLNYGLASKDKKWKTFEEIYQPYSNMLKDLNIDKPVMLTEFGCTKFGGSQEGWLENAWNKLISYKEIKSVVLYKFSNDKDWPCEWRPDKESQFIDWTLENEKVVNKHLAEISKQNEVNKIRISRNACKISRLNRNKNIYGREGHYDLYVNGRPFYIKGVAYNSGQRFDDEDLPLTRHQVVTDLNKIVESGANTISRYNPSIYDKNIIGVCKEKGLKILYGFWLEDTLNYLKDNKGRNVCMQEILHYVRKYKDEGPVLGWIVGNDVWNGLGKYYQPPYLNLMRQAYLEFVNEVTDSIHAIDPVHPVITSVSQNSNLAQAISDMYVFAPSVDIIGINSYYEEYLKELDKVMKEMDPTRPYLLTEFGSRGFWDQHLTIYTKDSLFYDEPDHLKAKSYFWKWIKHVEAKKGSNIGGLAYNFRDKPYGTASWSGISDYKGRLKPGYYYLKRVWTGEWDENTTDFYAEIKPETDKYFTQGTYNFYVESYQQIPSNLSFEWFLMRDSDMKYYGKLQRTYNGKGVKVSMPDVAGVYRIYVYMSDYKGNVVSASYPIRLETR
ncbi:MAG: glycosyltransferase [Cytophagaceae bacterium]